MTNGFTIPRFNRLNIPEDFLFLESQFRAYEITCQQVRLTCHLKDLTPTISKLEYGVFEKAFMTPYDDLGFAILERIEEPQLEFSKRLLKELMNVVANGLQPQNK
ncbi:unnamed protein product [Hymenolepis diminuta]|uniref:Uncharacterized protein n=1 Tax=Hymenolepis diminuta TaxID=6216 RepID=A0A564Z6Q8_HYMDI|nr:unnamed protein product [Hymenolepis diminuta]